MAAAWRVMRGGFALVFFTLLAACVELPDERVDDEGPSLEAKRVLDRGQHSGHEEAMRPTITNESAWVEFWAVHGSKQSPPPERPAVDFSKERVVAVLLGEKPNGCWAVRTGNVTTQAQHTAVEVITYAAGPEMACASVVTTPFDIIAIPVGESRVIFEDRTVEGPPPT